MIGGVGMVGLIEYSELRGGVESKFEDTGELTWQNGRIVGYLASCCWLDGAGRWREDLSELAGGS